jgi:hypothetical protein
LWIEQDVRHGVHSHLEIRCKDTHGLFTHGRLICVSGRL